MPTTPNQFDFFVSYARGDNANGWITRFVAELPAEHRRFAAERELKPFFDQHALFLSVASLPLGVFALTALFRLSVECGLRIGPGPDKNQV